MKKDPSTRDPQPSTGTWTDEKWEALAAPFPAEEVGVKPGAATGDKQRAMVLHFINARAVMKRLDETVGGENWHDRYTPLSADGSRMLCELTVLGVTKSGVGEGGGDTEPAKSAESDALKRAAVKFGIGRFLYYLPAVWEKLGEGGRRFERPPLVSDKELFRAARRAGWTGDGEEPGDEEAAAGGRRQEDDSPQTSEVKRFTPPVKAPPGRRGASEPSAARKANETAPGDAELNARKESVARSLLRLGLAPKDRPLEVLTLFGQILGRPVDSFKVLAETDWTRLESELVQRVALVDDAVAEEGVGFG